MRIQALLFIASTTLLTTAFPHEAAHRSFASPKYAISNPHPFPNPSIPHAQNAISSGGNENEEANVLAHLLEAYRLRHEQIALRKREVEQEVEKIGVGEGLVHMDVKGNGEGNGEEKPGKGFTDFLLFIFGFGPPAHEPHPLPE